jgi:branched-subunit amino acid transport protein
VTAWVVVLAAALCTYVLRASALVTVADRDRPSWVTQASAAVAPAALGALVASGALHNEHTVAVAVASGAALLAARRAGSPFAALVVGFPVLWVVQRVVG